MKIGRIELSTELLEQILTAGQNDYVTTDCPNDVKIVKVFQTDEDQANHRVQIVLESEEADWPIMPLMGEIPFVGPFTYTVEHPDEDESPPPTEGKSNG